MGSDIRVAGVERYTCNRLDLSLPCYCATESFVVGWLYYIRWVHIVT